MGKAMNRIGSRVTSQTLDAAIQELRDKVTEPESREVVLGADKDIIQRLCKELHDDPVLNFNYLSDITAVDWAEQEPRFEIVYRMYSLKDNRRLWIKVPLEGRDPSIDTVQDIWKNANWLERELWDMFGIKVKGHPDLRRILMPSMYIGHPLRKDFPIGGEEIHFSINEGDIVHQELYLSQAFEGMDFKGFIERADEIETYYGAAHLARAAEEGKLVVSMGPQHPSTHGVLRVVLALDGEQIDDAVLDIGYVHTGIEKTGEDLLYQQTLTLTDRMDYVAPLMNNLAYVLSVEKLLGIEIPLRVQYIRVILNELERIASHLIWIGTHALDIGAVTVFLYGFRDREPILDIKEMASGVRMMSSYINIGGLREDIPEGFMQKVQEFVNYFSEKLNDYHALLTNNPIWLERTKGIGYISLEDAINHGVSGPVLRGLGFKWDMRKIYPYSSYDHFDFEIPVGSNGDVYDRYLVRMEEMRQSLRIIQQALDNLPDEGGYRVEDYKIVLPPRTRIDVSMEALIHHFLVSTSGFPVPPGNAYVPTESPRGEMGFYIVSDGGPKPYRFRMRAPSFSTLQAIPLMSKGHMVADMVAILGSVDMIMGEVDR